MKMIQKNFFFLFVLLFFAKCQETCQPFSLPPDPPEVPISEVPYVFNETYQVIELDPSTGAKCLDGTNYKFLFTQGSGSGANKFMFSWQGGAYCGYEGLDLLESCYSRSQGPLGSSSFLPSNGSYYSVNSANGYFSNMQEYNPDFWNWNKVFISYCDGSNHQGHLDNALVYNGTELWFRGHDNTQGIIDYLKDNFGLFQASEVILSGTSAGGQATYFWSHYLQSQFPSTVKLMGLPDAGMFLDGYNYVAQCNFYRERMKLLMNLTKSAETDLFNTCKYHGTADLWKCMMAQYIVEDINIPMFIINSQDDHEALRTQIGITCLNVDPSTCTDLDISRIAEFRSGFLDIAHQLVANKTNWGFWLRTCLEHVYQGSWGWYGQQKNVLNQKEYIYYSLRDALHRWYNGGNLKDNLNTQFVDVDDWQHNLYCQYHLNISISLIEIRERPQSIITLNKANILRYKKI